MMSSDGKARRGKPAEARRTDSDSRSRDRAATVKHVRGILGRTQAELATALGVSEKAIQSYEQQWRDVPVRVTIQLLVLLALYRKCTMDDVPCWELRKCSATRRERCASFTMGRGLFCWFVGSKDCRPTQSGDPAPILPCMDCPVVKRLLRGRSVGHRKTGNRA